ncbi:hydrogenase expression/formation protein HypE [Serratia quinivorans]|uniref:hydrogenase expression/formation protein HypE n=1 Tax=Serratia quinivorans TaxID=137545 RepID=UPI0021796516|nr:hydrogenase expression/formation protein HypE [Serratia quinivorans]CAI1177929.1 Hydrogenase isoenzymes formation protein hypE [Serratia quinivorans]CAI1950960.1 Hydrogenase isoenzymes formation protein hypE [Serratia quinivorans]
MNNVITMAHGSGGSAMQQLLEEIFLPAFANPLLDQREDQARLNLLELAQQGDRLAFTTDSYVIDPIFFPGGDIGKLAVCGTANDLAVSGAFPRYLSCGFILEEGLPLVDLQRLVASMAATAQQAGIRIVTGDTKVVQRGAADKVFINTAGIGVIPPGLDWAAQNIRAGDAVIVSGTLGDHGATILNLREKLGMSLDVISDCAVLAPLIAPLRAINGVRAMRDATRGGVNAILHEFVRAAGVGIEVEENLLPIAPAVRGICELLGLDAINFANEGKLVVVAAPEAEQAVLAALQAHPLGKAAALIGRVTAGRQVRLQGAYGISRLLDLPHAEPLPRIC